MGRHVNGMHGCQTELALQQKLSKIRKCCCEIKSPFSIYLRGVLHFCLTKAAKHDTDYKTLQEKTFLTVILKTRRDEHQEDGQYPLLEGRLNWSFRENSGNLVYSKVRGLLFHWEV